MEYRKLGNSDLTVSAIGFGAWAAGGAWWGAVEEREVIAAMQKAFDLGVTLFDTAPSYNKGHSEEILAKAMGSHRHEIIIATKFGLVWDEAGTIAGLTKDASRQRILQEIDDSLRRLKTDYIDLYQQHWPDPSTPLEETMTTLLELQQAGKVRHIGVSNFDVPLLEEALRYAPIVSNQFAYSMLQDQENPFRMLRKHVEEDVFPFCRERGIGVLPWGPLHHGLLTGKFTPQDALASKWGEWRDLEPEFQGKRYLRNLRIVDKLKLLAAERGVTVGQLAINWTLRNPAVSATLVGAKRPSQIEENVEGAGWSLTDDDRQRIEEILASPVPSSEF
ncbi:MAG: aldo/keto reductase [Actinobacteria bacterium]|nr:aldo/keto reductase [Actinomycetota bacterium]